MKKALLICFATFLGLFTYYNVNGQSKKINWEKFLSQSDLVFDTLTTQWGGGAFIGNGLLGSMIYTKSANEIRFDIGRTDVYDHRENMSPLFGKCRLPIGYFILTTKGKIQKNTARLHLWNAMATGSITTDKGTISWTAFAHAQNNIVLVSTTSTGDEKEFAWKFVPERSMSSRANFSYVKQPENYEPNPQPAWRNKNSVQYVFQPLSAGGSYTTAWMELTNKDKRDIFISVGYSRYNDSSEMEAVNAIQQSSVISLKKMIKTHTDWWHNYYPQSYVSIPDKQMQKFYWIQQYKLASATRPGKPAIDLMGPWFYNTPWPAYWFNLNMQLTYSPLYTANRLGIAHTLVEMIDANKSNLALNVPLPYRYNSLAVGRAAGPDMLLPVLTTPQSSPGDDGASLETANLMWLLFYYWKQYRYSMDEEILKNLFPLLKGSVNYYIHLIKKESDGKWHLPYTYSPEYPGGITRDCNYDLAVLRWGCETLLKADAILRLNDGLKSKWQDILTNLTDYPTDSNGLRIGRDVPFNVSHRHFSHLLMIYPLYLMNWDMTEYRSLIERSLQHWIGFKGALQGYSYTGAASMYAMMGKGNEAYGYLAQFLKKYLKPNTMYMESGPVIETPLAAAQSIHELLLQSYDDKIKVFPAVPDDWKDAEFQNLRTEGGFLISAVRKDGVTKWVSIKSTAGGKCSILVNADGVIKSKSKVIIKDADGYCSFEIPKGQEVNLHIE